MIKYFFATALLMFSALTLASDPAGDALVAKLGDRGTLTVTLLPCETVAGVFATMPEALRKEFKAAKLIWDDKLYEACWTHSGATITVVDETGDGGEVPLSALKKSDVL